jgi:hypothetical protein
MFVRQGYSSRPKISFTKKNFSTSFQVFSGLIILHGCYLTGLVCEGLVSLDRPGILILDYH